MSYDQWCPENDGAWRSEQAELQRLMVERLIQPYLDIIDGLKQRLEMYETFDAAPDDADWQPPHPIFLLAEENDTLKAKVNELEEQVHYCPKCNEYCKQCTCWDMSYHKMEDQLEEIRSELECVECEEWCGKSPTKNDDGHCHICRIKKILEDIE